MQIGNGYQDTMTTVGAADYLVKQADWPVERVKLAYYPGGHMAYSVDSSAKAFGDDVRDWITGQGEPKWLQFDNLLNRKIGY